MISFLLSFAIASVVAIVLHGSARGLCATVFGMSTRFRRPSRRGWLVALCLPWVPCWPASPSLDSARR